MTALPDYAQALSQALRDIQPLNRIEEVALDESGGRVLAEPIIADRDLPPFNRAQMDGYALRGSEFVAGKSWPVIGMVAAGAIGDNRVPPGSCVAIATGAPLPRDVDTVIQHESSDRGNPVRFTVDTIQTGQAVHSRGADARGGDVLIKSGVLFAAHHLGIAAAVGVTTIRARAKPQAAILTSGDEVVPAGTSNDSLQPHQIRNSNGPQVAELLRRFGANPNRVHHLPDQQDITVEAVTNAITSHDLVITVGGVSAGERDYFPSAFEACGVVRTLQGASIQPGRPIVVGKAPNGAVIIGLPGNPVSVLACACLFAWPIVRVLLGLSPSLPWREVALAEAVKPNPHRRAFRPAILHDDGRVTVSPWAGSGDLAHTASTHGLVELPIQTEAVAAGSRLRFLPWP